MKKLFQIFGVTLLICLGFWSIKQVNLRIFHTEKKTRLMMGTYATITALGSKDIANKAINLAFIRMQEINIKFNPINPQSPVYAFNRKSQPITDPEIIGLIKRSLEISKDSGGAFDITVASLSELWGFYAKSLRIPKDEEIKECLRHVGYQHLLFKDGELNKDDQAVRIDFGGIAKGYALAEAAKVLKDNGITSALIDLGGDVYVLGKNVITPWKIGIKNPRGKDILGYIEAQDQVVASSGDYERFFIENKKRYHHIFNPVTGYPTEGVAGVTVIHQDPVLAQAWAKIPFILGVQKGIQKLNKIKDLRAVIITTDGQMIYSEDKLKINK
ncbi:MAG: FAD:protein FMN transferase [Candidatus Omnitrophica bacterium]|nr:FAD:protein FMN transferase [Candidatus Omnitrophota bacterium]